MFFVHRIRFTAYVVFSGADHGIFWRMFTPRGMRHVRIIIPADGGRSLMEDGRCTVIDPMAWAVAVQTVDKSARDLAEHILPDCTLVLRWPVDLLYRRDYQPRGVLTCVSLAKAILGISAWYVITPGHLARWMLRNGAQKLEI